MSYIDTQSSLAALKNSTSAVNAAKAKENAGNTEMTSDAFLQLMMIQMQNQDPEKPMDSSQMLAQQASFTQVSELQKINKSLAGSNNMAQSSSMIGMQVTATDPDDSTKQINGVVSEVSFNTSGTSLLVGDKTLPLSSVLKITSPYLQTTQNSQN
jgi:flagellar basal-body rod modification protein FlgD